MTPDIEKILKACLEDVNWFIQVFEDSAAKSDDDRYKAPLERFHKIRSRLELLGETVTAAMLRISQDNSNGANDEIRSELQRMVEQMGQLEGQAATTSEQLADIRKYISSSALDEIFRSLIRAAAGLGSGLPSSIGASASTQSSAGGSRQDVTIKKKVTEQLSPFYGEKLPTDFALNRYHVDLENRTVRFERVQCEDYEDALGGIARAFKVLEQHPVDDAYDPKALLIMNLGLLSGTDFMTGLRTYFHGYSPLKVGASGKPGSMWTAGSGKFGTKLRFLNVDEVFLTGRSDSPVVLRVTSGEVEQGMVPEGRSADDGFGEVPHFHFDDGAELVGKLTNDKIQMLKDKHGKNAHFAVIGPAGENFQNVRYAAIALSTVNQLKSSDNKPRFCGRGGFGGVLGSKGVVGLVAHCADKLGKPSETMKKINKEIARGKGSARFRDKRKGNGGGGTWANYEALQPVHAMPEMNFVPTGGEQSVPLFRPNVEATGEYVVKDEACFRCGIACHKNVYDAVDKNGKTKAGRFRAKLDFEPLNLLASNIGIFDIDQACELVELVDLYGMDSISLGVTLSFAMEYNKRNASDGAALAGGLSYGDYQKAHDAIVAIGMGQMPELGQGTRRLGEQLGAGEYSMNCKGVEFPAYLPQTNPGYPWALAGGHMSMRTYLLLLYEKETSVDYWLDAITNRGPNIMRDDIIGVCKFSGINNDMMAEAIADITGMKINGETLTKIVMRTYLRGYRMERSQGFTDDDYSMPSLSHDQFEQIELPYFNTPEFFNELKGKVLSTFDQRVQAESW